MLASAEFVCHIEIVGSIVAGQFAEHAIAKININDFVVLARCEKCITWVMSCLTDPSSIALSSLLRSLSWVLHFANLVPLALSVAPHVSESNSVFTEHLDKAIRLASHFALNVIFEVWKISDIDLLATLRRSLALFFVLVEVSTGCVFAVRITSELANLLVFSAHDDIAPRVMRQSPHRLWKLDSLFALAIGPQLDTAIVASSDDLSSIEAVNGENKATVSPVVQHMGAIHRPKLDNLIV